MARNILVLIGSPIKNGNTEMLADAFIELIRAEHEEMETQLRWTFSGTRGEG